MAGDGGGGGFGSLLTKVSVGIGIVVAAVGLAFQLRPGLRPCLGDERAKFTGAPVFPSVRYREHAVRVGRLTQAQARREPNLVGAEVRFTFETDGFRGEELPITYSLVAVNRDGTLGALVPGKERAPAFTVRPDSCSGSGGHDLFVPIPEAPRRRYRIVLELYRDFTFNTRLALVETETFAGGRAA